MPTRIKFEDRAEEIDGEIAKRRGKWQLNALSYMDFEDVSQLLRIHILNKWDKWDQSRPLAQWVNRVITRRMINIARDNYGHLAPPCNGCKHNLDADHCSFTTNGLKCAECPLYKKWQGRKESGYNIKLASSIDSEFFSEKNIVSSLSDYLDYDSTSNKLHAAMKKKLTDSQWRVYKLMFIDNMDDDEIAKILKLKSNENRKPGYRHLFLLKAKFLELAKTVIKEQDII